MKIGFKGRIFHKFLPPLQIHIWGGLGSQLFGLLAVEEVGQLFPARKLEVVFHSGGVTARHPDVIELIPEGLKVSFVDDFFSDELIGSSKKFSNSNFEFVNYIKKAIAHKLKLIVSWDKSSEGPRFWTFQLRGHYRMLKVNPNTLESTYKRIKEVKLDSYKSNEEKKNAIHFRIGDLVGLKGIIDPSDILRVAGEIQERNHLRFTVLSDSQLEAYGHLATLNLDKTSPFLSTWETIKVGYESAAFIGTFSKISYWIVILRVLSTSYKISYLPRPVALELKDYFNTYSIEANIVPYDSSIIEK